MRDWFGNRHFESIDKNYVQNVLGLKWNCSDDTLFCSTTLPHIIPEEITRRSLLSYTQQIYDPLGFTAPVSLIPKAILQKTRSLKISWDDKLPKDLQLEYFKWSNTMGCITECKIPRRIIANSSSTLHVLCDASTTRYGACIFVRTEVNNTVHISLILVKSRVSPTKQSTLPRLELIGALTGVRLCVLAIKCLDHPNITVRFYWS